MLFKGFVAVWVSLIIPTLGICPSQRSIVAPCHCENNTLTCSGSQINDEVLEIVMDILNNHLEDNQKHFTAIQLRDTELIKLKENVFKNLTFDSIEVLHNLKLETIDTNALTATNFKTKSITLHNLNALKQTPESFFDVLSKISSLEFIHIDYGLNISEIPSNAFKPLNGHQNHLKTIYFRNTPFKKIGSRAFYYLNSLESLNFHLNYKLDHIMNYAFEFEKTSTQPLQISLTRNLIYSSSFETDSLRYIKRPTTLGLAVYDYVYYRGYFDEGIFLPFLFADPKNSLHCNFYLDCKDCRNAWLKEYAHFMTNKWECGPEYEDAIDFNDPNTFSQCRK